MNLSRLFVVSVCLSLSTAFAQANPPKSIFKPSDDIIGIINSLPGMFADNAFDADTCAPTLQKVVDYFSGLRATSPAMIQHRDELLEQHDQIVNRLWLSRVSLRDRIRALYLDGSFTANSGACANGLRNYTRVIRHAEEFLIGIFYKDAKVPPHFGGEAPSLMLNPKFEVEYDRQHPEKNFRSGDIVLSRGGTSISATIARISKYDQQFSHIILVYRDPQTGQAYTIEAHIEDGVTVAPIKKMLGANTGRVTLFRHPDADLAHRAAEFMYRLAKRRQDMGVNIRYGFNMVLEDYFSRLPGPDAVTQDDLHAMFCPVVIRDGYAFASQHQLMVPMFQSELGFRNNRSVLDALGIQVTHTFAPADIEADPRFEMVADWRQTDKIEDMHQMDATLTKVFEWVNKYNYTFRPEASGQSDMALFGLWVRQNVPALDIFGVVKDKMPPYMTRSQAAIVGVINSVVGSVRDDLVKKEDAYIAVQKKAWKKLKPRPAEFVPMPMTFRERLDALDDVREEDLKRHREFTNAPFDPDGYGPTVSHFHRQIRAEDEPPLRKQK
ncbi:MAG: hypothetical protein AB7P04_11550 [Bacteriovoracia bacterium]